MSFTCGHFGSAGGIGVEMGKPAGQNLYIGVKRGPRRSTAALRCLPFFKVSDATASPANSAASSATSLRGENLTPAAPGRSYECYGQDQIRRSYRWATDAWTTPDFTFSIYTPFAPIPDPGRDGQGLRAVLLPAVIATLEVDNRTGTDTKTAVFAIDFAEPGTRLLRGDSDAHDPAQLGFGWRRSIGVLGAVEGGPYTPEDFVAIQRWSVAEALSDVNPIHPLGTCGGLALEVPPGAKRTLVLAIGVYLDGVVTTGLEGRYHYTRFYAGIDDVLSAALERAQELRALSGRLDEKLLACGLSPEQQFLIAHGTRGYYANTQLLDVGGKPFWIVNEGEYCMMNTLDLSVDHAFWELKQNPWVVANVLTNFVRHYSYHDQVKTRSGQTLPGGISFAHDMGVHNNFAPPGHSSYELAHLNGCFSYMTQEQLCNWVITAACYVAKTRDSQWLLANGPVIAACRDSMKSRAHPRTGLMIHDSSRCGQGQEITTYDSLDESLGQARANSYLAVKCWATWLALDLLSRLRALAGETSPELKNNFADELEKCLTASVLSDTIPAVLETDSPGYGSRILPVVEALIYPAYWLDCLGGWPAGAAADAASMLRARLTGGFIDTLRKHTLALLNDPNRSNLFPDGGIKLSSSSNNSWMSKIALFQHVARTVLGLVDSDAAVTAIFKAADAAHVRWQTDGSGPWACCDQYVSGEAKGSRYYPRVITAALWMDASSPTPHAPQPEIRLAAPVSARSASRQAR